MIKFLNDSVLSETLHLAFEHPSLCVGQDGLELTSIPRLSPTNLKKMRLKLQS